MRTAAAAATSQWPPPPQLQQSIEQLSTQAWYQAWYQADRWWYRPGGLPLSRSLHRRHGRGELVPACARAAAHALLGGPARHGGCVDASNQAALDIQVAATLPAAVPHLSSISGGTSP